MTSTFPPKKQAEEKAGGMDYEFWHCPKCGADEKLAVKLGKASKCPQCRPPHPHLQHHYPGGGHQGAGRAGRASPRAASIPSATTAKTREHAHAAPLLARLHFGKLLAPSSGSFGGGRSGGGGASKQF